MDSPSTPEKEALREQAREFLTATPEPSWSQLAELGWTGVSIAEDEGGASLSFVEEAVLFEGLGRARRQRLLDRGRGGRPQPVVRRGSCPLRGARTRAVQGTVLRDHRADAS